MMDWVHILLLAFSLQLLSLPGEKGQIVISTLATRYSPVQVVAGAAAAFGAWTAIELLVGGAISSAVPAPVVDAVFVALLLGFAGWMLYTAGRTRNESEREGFEWIPERFRGIGSSFILTGAGEFGDKTQIITFGLAAKYGPHPAIWLGEMLAIVPVTAMNAVLVDRAVDTLETRRVYRISALLLVIIALDVIASYVLGASLLPV